MDIEHAEQVEQAVSIVTAYVSHHHVPTGELSALLASVHGAIVRLGAEGTGEPEHAKPSRKEINASVRRDGLVSFIDGKPYKTLKRHLAANGLTPDAYRERYGLPSHYPMAAQAYSEQRSALAKKIGLGKPPTTNLHAVA